MSDFVPLTLEHLIWSSQRFWKFLDRSQDFERLWYKWFNQENVAFAQTVDTVTVSERWVAYREYLPALILQSLARTQKVQVLDCESLWYAAVTDFEPLLEEKLEWFQENRETHFGIIFVLLLFYTVFLGSSVLSLFLLLLLHLLNIFQNTLL